MRTTHRVVIGLILLGGYVTLRGYHSLDGDQAYRLPLLLHQQDASLYADDPFVTAFDVFNPHRGVLTFLDGLSRLVGLNAALFLAFSAAFLLTVSALDRLARAVWPASPPGVGLTAIVLVLLTKAGNIGTNHLFEAMFLDRLLALGLGWQCLALLVEQPRRLAIVGAPMIATACWIHPSLGLQLGMLLIAGLLVAGAFPAQSGISGRLGLGLAASLAVGLAPSFMLMASQGGRLFAGLSADDFRSLCLEIQSPQHMLPHLWREPQWLAFFCFPIWAGLGVLQADRPWPVARLRWAGLLGINLIALLCAWIAIEPLANLRIAVFQPFRMATVARGLCLIAAAGRVVALWNQPGWSNRARAALFAFGLTGDLALVAATLGELTWTCANALIPRWADHAGVLAITFGLVYLTRHDTQSGQVPLLIGLGLAVGAPIVVRIRGGQSAPFWTRRRALRVLCLAWIVPLVAVAVPLSSWSRTESGASVAQDLARRWRFGETPIDDIERLALWGRAHLPETARFIGPPGPKTFRLWSRRAVAFNRAASPYHAAGLADWAERFRAHVGFEGSTAAFARAYLDNRQALEAGYESLDGAALDALAASQGAGFILASSRLADPGPLVPLRRSGRLAIYQRAAIASPTDNTRR